MNLATREANKFSRDVNGMGQTLNRTGRVATAAAASFSNLASVIPQSSNALAGFARTASTATSILGTAGIVMGETAIISAGLTKGWALLGAAGSKLVAGLGPMAASFGPVGLAIAATAALVVGLGMAWTKAGRDAEEARRRMSSPLGPGVRSIEDLNIDSRRMPLTSMTGARAHTLSTVTTSATSLGGGADFAVAASLAKTATDQWSDAVKGIRPVITSLITDWNSAMSAVNKALQNTVKMTKDEVTELYRLKAALLDVKAVAPPMTAREAVDQIKALPSQQKMFGHGLDPAKFLGDKFTKPLEGIDQKALMIEGTLRSGFAQLTQAIVTILPLHLAQIMKTRTTAGAVGSLLGSSFGAGAGQFLGDIAAKKVGGLLGAGLGSVIPGLGTVVGGVLGGLAGDFIGGLFGHKKKRAEEQSADSLLKLAKAAEKVTESISNLPVGFKVSGYRFDAALPMRDNPGMIPVRNDKMFFIENLNILASDPATMARQTAQAAEMQASRGGATGLTIAVTRTTRGF